MAVSSEEGQVARPCFLSKRDRLSPVQALRLLFSYPYCNLISQFHFKTREYETGLLFVDRCRDLLEWHSAEIPKEECQRIERDVTFLELALYDALNLWQEYLDFFERIFREKRTKAYIGTYNLPNATPEQLKERFGRYLMVHNGNLFVPTQELQVYLHKNKEIWVHELYLCERQRVIIARKLKRQQEGKSVEHLKRHQKDRLSDREQQERFSEMERLFEWMKKQ